MPENKPSKTVIKIASTRFKTKERITSNNPEIVNEIPNNLLLENCANTLGPNEIPSASPKIQPQIKFHKQLHQLVDHQQKF